jgi:hypothetical protein
MRQQLLDGATAFELLRTRNEFTPDETKQICAALGFAPPNDKDLTENIRGKFDAAGLREFCKTRAESGTRTRQIV